MARFSLQLRNLDDPSEVDHLVVEADSATLAEEGATRAGWIVTRVLDADEDVPPSSFWHWFTADIGRVSERGRSKKQIKGKPLITMCKAIGSMLRGGLGLETALHFYAKGLEDRDLASVLRQVRKRIVSEGLPPSQAFELAGRFDSQFLAVMRASDESSSLGVGLRKIAEQRERISAMKSQLSRELFMPALAVIVLIAAFVYFQYGYVLTMEEIIRDMRVDPGPLMGFVFFLGGLTRSGWPLGVAGVVVVAIIMATQPVVRRKFIDVFVRLSKTVRRMVNGLRQLVILNTMDLILNCHGPNRGLGMEAALTAAIDVSRGDPLSAELERARALWVSEGTRMEEALQGTSLDPAIKHLIAVGEPSSSFGTQVGNLVGMYEEVTGDAIFGFVRFADVASKLVAAVLILLLASSVLLPLLVLGPKMINPPTVSAPA